MGSIFRYEHKDCGFEYKHFDGVGFMGMELEQKAYEKIKNGECGEDWQKLLQDNPYAKVTVHNALSYCEKCKKYHSIPQMKLYIPKDSNVSEEDKMFFDPEKYTLAKKEIVFCPDCMEETVDIENSFFITCPVCGKEIKGKFAGLWD